MSHDERQNLINNLGTGINHGINGHQNLTDSSGSAISHDMNDEDFVLEDNSQEKHRTEVRSFHATQTNRDTSEYENSEHVKDEQRHSNVIEFSDKIDIAKDEYCIMIKKLLNDFSKNNNHHEHFVQLYKARFAHDPNIELDVHLYNTLKSHSLSNKQLMVLTQKHFNDFGGSIITDEDVCE